MWFFISWVSRLSYSTALLSGDIKAVDIKSFWDFYPSLYSRNQKSEEEFSNL